MPRGPRKLSATGVYHIMTRGTNKQEIYVGYSDMKKFMKILSNARRIHSFKLYAFCLMPNHNHLVVKDQNNSIHRFMQLINVSYARYFNWKHNRVGHLFQDRYRSEEILTESQLLACIRYVHNNPYKAGMVSSLEKYPWSSYNLYLRDDPEIAIDRESILGLFSEDNIIARKQFMEFSQVHDDNMFLDLHSDSDEQHRISLIQNVIASILTNHNMTVEALCSRSASKNRAEVLQAILQTTGVSVKELSEMLGISSYMIYRSFYEK